MKTIIVLILCLITSVVPAENRNIMDINESVKTDLTAVIHNDTDIKANYAVEFSLPPTADMPDGFYAGMAGPAAEEKADVIIIEGSDLIPYAIIFSLSGKEYGRLEIKNDSIAFKGDTDKSAQVFFDGFLKPIVERYIKLRCGK